MALRQIWWVFVWKIKKLSRDFLEYPSEIIFDKTCQAYFLRNPN